MLEILIKFSGIGAQTIATPSGEIRTYASLKPGSTVRLAPSITAEVRKTSGEKGDLLPCYIEAIATIHAERQGE